MAVAKKCDICGRLYESYNEPNNEDKINGLMFLNIDKNQRYFSHKAMDCCPECMKKIKEFIEELKSDRPK